MIDKIRRTILLGTACRLLCAAAVASQALSALPGYAATVSTAEYFTIIADPQSMAMGGGVLSLPDSPAVMFSNPAATALVYQPRITINNTLFPDNLNFSCGAMTYPTSFGTWGAGVSYLSYGNTKDYRGQDKLYPVGSSNDTMGTLSYALPIRKDIPITDVYGSIGFAIKAINSTLGNEQSQQVLGDLGAIYKFLPKISGSVVYRNIGAAATNTLKLANAMPATLDCGLRYESGGWRKFAVVGGVSNDISNDISSFWGGVSISPVYPATFRFGWRETEGSSASGFRAGLGLDFNDIGFNYSVIPVRGDPMVHQLGIDIAFGKISQPRMAYDHFLRYHFEQAKEKYNRMDYIAARQQLEEILSVYPTHQPSKDYLVKIGEALDAMEEQRAIGIEKWLRKASVAASKNDMVRARRYYYYVLGVDPQNEIALDALQRIDDRVYQFQSEGKKRQNVETIRLLWKKAMGLYQKGDYVSARETFKELLRLDPENIQAKKYMEEIDGQLQKITAMQINELYVQGTELFNKGDYRAAMKYFGAVVTAAPHRIDAQSYFTLCEKTIKEEEERNRAEKAATAQGRIRNEVENSYANAVKLYERGDYSGALKAFAKSREVADYYGFDKFAENAKNYMTLINGTLAEKHFKEGFDYFQQNRLELAAGEYREALQYYPEYTSARVELDRISDTLSQQLYEQGMKMFTSGDLDKAKELFKKSLSFKPDKAESLRALERIK
jgi:tetratricopeptide (TPR) repeat protein